LQNVLLEGLPQSLKIDAIEGGRMALIQLDRKTNILALTSFLLSLLAIGHQVFDYFAGAKVELFPPSVVTLTKHDYRTNGKEDFYFIIEAPMTYANRGQVGYNDVVKRETVRFTGPNGKEVVLAGLYYFNSIEKEGSPDELVYTEQRGASPVLIPARSGISHETRFVSFNVNCGGIAECERQHFIHFDEALNFLGKQEKLELQFAAELISGSEPKVARCTLKLTQLGVSELKRKGWVALQCEPSKPS
jgi:hypothetical protein